MKYSIHRITEGEDELILNYRELTPEVERILQFMNRGQTRLPGRVDGETVLFAPEEVLYIETVDDKTFAYTKEKVIRLDMTLSGVEERLKDISFFRCSKSMIVNIDKVERLKSMSSNRIDAMMQNGEHIVISRTYASEFRRLLRSWESCERRREHE